MTPWIHAILPAVLDAATKAGMCLATGALVGRGFCLRRLLTVHEARMVRLSDSIFWVGAAILTLAQIARLVAPGDHGSVVVILCESLGMAFLLGLEVWPSRIFRSWDRYLDLDQLPYHTDRNNDLMRIAARIQLGILAILCIVEPLLKAILFPHA